MSYFHLRFQWCNSIFPSLWGAINTSSCNRNHIFEGYCIGMSKEIKALHDQLNLIEGKERSQYRRFDSHSFMKKDNRGKCTPSYEGVHVVKKILLGGALILPNMDEEHLHLSYKLQCCKKIPWL
ncbi:hypothetical protein Lal_00039625, partial [Lupinus albus]